MKKFAIICLITLTICCGAILGACKDTTISVEKITLDKTSVTLYIGQKEKLTATVTPNNSTTKVITWVSYNSAVASVSNGVITAVKEGQTVVTAQAEGKKATCSVTVKRLDVWDETIATEEQIANVYDESTATYTVTSASQLAWIAQKVNTLPYNTFAGKTIKLANDINLNNKNWTAIGNVNSYPSKTFAGTFDGNGYTIFNLTVNASGANEPSGFFGSIYNATIKNLTIDGATINGNHYVGALVAYIGDGANTIENCTVNNATVTSLPNAGLLGYDNGDKAGALVGYMAGSTTVSHCDVTNCAVTAYRDVGGLVGCANSLCVVTNNSVKNITVTQDNQNDYGKPETDKYADQVIGRVIGEPTLQNNTTDNVTVTRKDTRYNGNNH